MRSHTYGLGDLSGSSAEVDGLFLVHGVRRVAALKRRVTDSEMWMISRLQPLSCSTESLLRHSAARMAAIYLAVPAMPRSGTPRKIAI